MTKTSYRRKSLFGLTDSSREFESVRVGTGSGRGIRNRKLRANILNHKHRAEISKC